MDRIKRLSMEILEDNKEKFGTDFNTNKKMLEEISIVRSKELKNELAGFITQFIKREIRDNEEKLAKEAEIAKKESGAEDTSSIPNEASEAETETNVQDESKDSSN